MKTEYEMIKKWIPRWSNARMALDRFYAKAREDQSLKVAIDRALLTWYPPDSPKYKDPEHPTLKLAGEIGELLDLYAKHKFKPDFDWTQCKNCSLLAISHNSRGWCSPTETIYIPLVLDELGDIWYYLRILAWMKGFNLVVVDSRIDDPQKWIILMFKHASQILNGPNIELHDLDMIYCYLIKLLENLGCTLDELTELNYQKLNSEPTNHGWRDAK